MIFVLLILVVVVGAVIFLLTRPKAPIPPLIPLAPLPPPPTWPKSSLYGKNISDIARMRDGCLSRAGDPCIKTACEFDIYQQCELRYLGTPGDNTDKIKDCAQTQASLYCDLGKRSNDFDCTVDMGLCRDYRNYLESQGQIFFRS